MFPFCSLITFRFLCVLLLSFPCLWFLLLSFASFLFLFFPCSWFNAGSALIIVPVRVLRRYFPLESFLWLSVPFLTLSFILILHRSFAFLFCHLWFSVGSALISALARVPRSCRCSILPFPLFPFLSLPFLSFPFLSFPFPSLPFLLVPFLPFFLLLSCLVCCAWFSAGAALISALSRVPRSFVLAIALVPRSCRCRNVANLYRFIKSTEFTHDFEPQAPKYYQDRHRGEDQA